MLPSAHLRATLASNPQDWQTALAYKAALATEGRYAEGDPIFQQARRHFPDAPWLAHLAGLYAFPHPELPALIARARPLAEADPTLQTLLGDMLTQARDHAGAATAYARDPHPDARARETQARDAQDRTEWLQAAPEFGPAPHIAVINLDRNAARLAELDGNFAACRPPRFRVPGIEGSRLPAAAIARLGGDPAMRGTLGCFLAHAAAWEAMLAHDLAYCLIVEDDVIPLFDLPERWGMFALPDALDLCFVNDRMAPPPDRTGFRIHPLAGAMRAFPYWRNAPGADGYLLTAAGARKLLAWVAQDGFAADVDWRLLAYGLTPAEQAALPADSHASWALSRLAAPSRPDRLAAAVMSPPLIRTVPLASDREDENRAGVAPSSAAQILHRTRDNL